MHRPVFTLATFNLHEEGEAEQVHKASSSISLGTQEELRAKVEPGWKLPSDAQLNTPQLHSAARRDLPNPCRSEAAKLKQSFISIRKLEKALEASPWVVHQLQGTHAGHSVSQTGNIQI